MTTPKPRGTAAITGASSGIGEVFARRLAAAGYSLLLVARTEAKLAELCEELHRAHGVVTEYLVADLAVEADVERVARRIGEIADLTLLVNNAGFGATGSFAGSDIGQQIGMLMVHDAATLRLTHAALPGMLERKRGTIINVSSISGFLPVGNVVYSATKAFLNIFSLALGTELRGSGVKVQALCPGLTYTRFHDTPDFAKFDRKDIPKVFWMPAEAVVDCSLRALRRNRVIVIPGWKNRLIVRAFNSPLGRLMRAVADQLRRNLR